MATIKDILESGEYESKCSFCGYNEYSICLTAHHIFMKNYFKPQPKFERIDRYIVLCTNCHFLLHHNIFVNDGKQQIIDIIERCKTKYSKNTKIDKIIDLISLIYKIPYEEPKAL